MASNPKPRKTMPVSSSSNLPPELLFDILVRLPPKDLLRSMCVSKSWNAFICDKRFIKAHLQRSIETNSSRTILLLSYAEPTEPIDFFSLPFDGSEAFGSVVKIEHPLNIPGGDTGILGCSINGVVCIHSDNTRVFALWNPSIQKFKKIPLPTFTRPSMGYDRRWGFGYDSDNDDYKLVGILTSFTGDNDDLNFQVIVYSLKSNSWKRIRDIPCNGCKPYSNEMVFSNGALCWLVYKRNEWDENEFVILSLDLACEKYRQFPSPVDVHMDDDLYAHVDDDLRLEVLGGYLGTTVNYSTEDYDFWIMKEYGVAESWTLLYSIKLRDLPRTLRHYRPLGFSKNGQMVLLIAEIDMPFWYDLEKKSVEEVKISDSSKGLQFEATVCEGSLCLLDGNPVINERKVSGNVKDLKHEQAIRIREES